MVFKKIVYIYIYYEVVTNSTLVAVRDREVFRQDDILDIEVGFGYWSSGMGNF